MTGRGAYKPRKAIPVPRTLGERIQAWRHAFRMTQRDLAIAVRVPQQSISAWEKDLKEPSGPSLEQLIRVMGIGEQALRTGEGFQVPDTPWFGYLDTPITSGGGDLVAKEEGSKKLVILPAADVGEAWGVVMDGAGRRDPLTREMALEWVERAFENNQPLWIVVKSESKRKLGFLRRKPKA